MRSHFTVISKILNLVAEINSYSLFGRQCFYCCFLFKQQALLSRKYFAQMITSLKTDCIRKMEQNV